MIRFVAVFTGKKVCRRVHIGTESSPHVSDLGSLSFLVFEQSEILTYIPQLFQLHKKKVHDLSDLNEMMG